MEVQGHTDCWCSLWGHQATRTSGIMYTKRFGIKPNQTTCLSIHTHGCICSSNCYWWCKQQILVRRVSNALRKPDIGLMVCREGALQKRLGLHPELMGNTEEGKMGQRQDLALGHQPFLTRWLAQYWWLVLPLLTETISPGQEPLLGAATWLLGGGGHSGTWLWRASCLPTHHNILK